MCLREFSFEKDIYEIQISEMFFHGADVNAKHSEMHTFYVQRYLH